MTEIWFYLLADDTSATQLNFIIRLAEIAIKRQRQVVIYCPETAYAQQLDDYLWTHSQPSSFIPHSLDFQCPAPIQITQHTLPAQGDIFLNLSHQTPDITRYQRLVEIINPRNREASRSRWRHYQQQGFTPELKPIT